MIEGASVKYLNNDKKYYSVRIPFEFKDEIKGYGMVYNRKTASYLLPRNLQNCAILERLFPYINFTGDRRALEQEASEVINIRDDDAIEYSFPVKADLFAHQKKGAAMALKRFEQGYSGFAYLFEMRCGKTLTAMSVIGKLAKDEKIQRCLILAPATVCSGWHDDLEQYADFPYADALLLGSSFDKLYGLNKLKASTKDGIKIAITNYEALRSLDVYNHLREFAPQFVIADESQRIKSHTAIQTKRAIGIADNASYRLILSGTPIQNHADDIFSQYRFMDSSVFGTNYYSFRDRYLKMGGYQNYQIIGTKNTDELMAKIHSAAYRVTQKECFDLPAQIHQTIKVKMAVKQAKEYEELRREGFCELETGEVTASTVLTKIIRLHQYTGGFITDDNKVTSLVNSAKLDALKDVIIDNCVEAGKKIVVVVNFTSEYRHISQMLAEMKIPFAAIDGSVPASKRGGLIKSFQEGNAQVFLGQIQAISEGIKLTAADTMVLYSVDYNYATYSQVCARITGTDQKNKTVYIHLVTQGTIDTVIERAIAKKTSLANHLVDGWRSLLAAQ